tara:strand:+ start:1682 stop:1846 length:165 start_codon:yes stop_codon:yes gene_type:complete
VTIVETPVLEGYIVLLLSVDPSYESFELGIILGGKLPSSIVKLVSTCVGFQWVH